MRQYTKGCDKCKNTLFTLVYSNVVLFGQEEIDKDGETGDDYVQVFFNVIKVVY